MNDRIMPTAPVELTDLELDAVSGGQQENRQAGLVNVNAQLQDIRVNILNDSQIAANVALLSVQERIEQF